MKDVILKRALAFVLFFLISVPAFSGADSLKKPKTMDGVVLKAVESYWNPRRNEISLGFGVYPFNAYYEALSMDGGYVYHFGRRWAWEILHIAYFSTFDKGLITELADTYQVNPTSIERLQIILSTHIENVVLHGKFVFLEDLIRYFRVSYFFGGSFISTSVKSYIGADLGIKFEVFSGKIFSWKLEVRDSLAVSSLDNYLYFNLGIGFDF